MTAPLSDTEIVEVLSWYLRERGRQAALAAEARLEGEPTPDSPQVGTKLDRLADELSHPLDLEALAYTARRLSAFSEALAALRREIDARIVVELGDGGAAMIGGLVVRYGTGAPRLEVARDRQVDFLEFLDDHHEIARVLSFGYVRKTALRVVAERRGIETRTIVDTFLEERFARPHVEHIEPERTRSLQDLNEGEVRRRPVLAREEVEGA